MSTSHALRRVYTKVSSPAMGAMAAQIWQALGSFGIQIGAAWILGAEGLGLMATCLGIIIVATAVASGMVGDSLTVLDRHQVSVRSALQAWTIILVVSSSTLTAGGLWLTGLLSLKAAVAFWLACAFFQIEEIVRRIFMVTMRFWSLVVIDSAALFATAAAVAVTAATGRITVGSFLWGVAIGQLVGIAVGIGMLPAKERELAPLKGAAMRQVLGFGGFRGIQVAVGPTALTLARLAMSAAVGLGALGAVEAARIFTAPAMLVVQGLGSFLMSSYVRNKDLPLATLRARATKASALLSVGALGFGVVAALLAPVLGRWISGGDFEVSALAVMGWASVAAATATLQPFSSLAVARGHQRGVLVIRLIDALTGLTTLLVALFVFRMPADIAPYATALGIALGGVLVRVRLLSTAAEADPERATAGERSPATSGNA